jgi:type II secretory ATPase GspE/PulE/Tfp pilus assembly ATPase PilB-like protein
MKDFLRLIASFLIFSFVFPSVTLAVSASYQSTTTVDSLWRTNGSINAMAVGPDNTLYLAGDFTSLSKNAAGIGIFDVATGTLLYPSVNTNGTINAAIPDGSGGWYIGGSFTKVNGTTRNNVARVTSTGTLVTAFDADISSIVYALAATGTTLYIGGSFSTVNGATTRRFLAAVDKTTGTVVSGFNAGLSSTVQAIVVSGDKIVAGGNFTSAASSSVPASSIVVLNATTGAVAGTLPGLTAAVSIGSLTTDDAGTIYAGGSFSYAGFSVKNLAMINATSGLRLASSTVLSDGAISTIVPDGSGGWYVGGAFTSIGGTTIKRAARINSDGSVNTTFNPDPNSTVSAIAVSGSRVYLGGILYDKLSLPKSVQDALVTRIKILSEMKIDEHRTPQDGRFNFKTGDKEVDLRISTIPTANGEKIVIRLLWKSGGIPTLQDLGLNGMALKNLETSILRPHGIILVCGPTGSGKTTTLYAVLARLNTTRVNILSLEDPIEYQISGVNQVQINPSVGLTFASGLKSFLRQDPNIILVGEIRDQETTDLALQAALTGHLVFSTLHTSDAAGALPRLLDLGAERFLLASTITAIVGQRIVRKICNTCKEPYIPPPRIIDEIKVGLGSLFPKPEGDGQVKLYKGRGCAECGNSGYRGRIGIYEVLVLSDKISSLILEHPETSAIQKEAVAEGMITMKQDGYLKVLKGLTTLEEVLRVAQE